MRARDDLHVVGVASGGILVVCGDVDNLAGLDGQILITLCVSCSDLGTLGVKGNSNLTTLLSLDGGTGIVNDRLVVFVGTVGKVHADNIKSGGAQLVDGLDRVGLGANGADDGGTAEVLLRAESCVERSEPGNLAAQLEVLFGSGSHDAVSALAEGLRLSRHGDEGQRSAGGKGWYSWSLGLEV